MAMDLLPGGDLQKYIDKTAKKGKEIPEEDAIIIMKSLLKGLAYMHRNNVIHRDIKPENCIFADKNDLSSLKIIDFGLSK